MKAIARLYEGPGYFVERVVTLPDSDWPKDKADLTLRSVRLVKQLWPAFNPRKA